MILEEKLKHYNNNNFSEAELANYFKQFHEICGQFGEDSLIIQRILFYFCHILLEEEKNTPLLILKFESQLRTAFNLYSGIEQDTHDVSEWRDMFILFLLDFMKEQFKEFQIDHSCMSQFKYCFNYFTGRNIDIEQLAKLLDLLPDFHPQIKINRIERLFCTIHQFLNEIIEERESMFDVKQFQMLQKCQSMFENIKEFFNINYESALDAKMK